MRQCSGTLYIISAPSGTGKTTLTRELVRQVAGLQFAVSYTTRSKRDHEQEAQDYFYVNEELFKDMIKKGAFLEYTQIFGNSYGTSRTFIEHQLEQSLDVVLNLDWCGARNIKQRMECTTIFLVPPSKEVLRQRLEGRKREDQAQIEERLKHVGSEVAHYKEFDYIVINDTFNQALEDLKAIIRTNRLRTIKQVCRNYGLLTELENS